MVSSIRVAFWWSGDTGASVTINVQNASGGAKLDAWMDFNQDGDWDDAGEQILTNTAVSNGDNVLTFQCSVFGQRRHDIRPTASQYGRWTGRDWFSGRW